MMIAVPLDEQKGPGSKVCDHFGSAPFLAFVETESGSLRIMGNADMQHEHGQCNPVDTLAGMGVKAVICRGIGARAASRLESLGVGVFMAGNAGTLAEVLENYGNGALSRADPGQACHEHNCNG